MSTHKPFAGVVGIAVFLRLRRTNNNRRARTQTGLRLLVVGMDHLDWVLEGHTVVGNHQILHREESLVAPV